MLRTLPQATEQVAEQATAQVAAQAAVRTTNGLMRAYAQSRSCSYFHTARNSSYFQHCWDVKYEPTLS